METGYGNSVPEKPKNMLTRTIMNKLLIPLFNTSIKKEELIRKFTEYDDIEEENILKAIKKLHTIFDLD